MKKGTRLAAVAATAIAAIVALAACTSTVPTNSSGEAGDTLTLGSIVQPISFDPADVQEGNYVQYAQPVYDSLLLRKPDGSIAPFLATEWEWSDDLLELTLTLRDDVTFTDGEAFDGEAAKANLIHFRDSTGPHADLLSNVTDVRVDDAHKITLVLDAPNPALLESLGNMAGMMASPAQLDTGSLKTTPVGSGPFVLDASRTVSGDTYTYTRNADYWNDDVLTGWDTLVIKYLADNTARTNAIISGQIDGGPGGANEQAEAAGLNIVYAVGNWGGMTLFDRDGTLNPAMGDVRVRQAINYAIDKSVALKLVEAYGTAFETASIFDPAGPAFTKAAAEAYPLDLDKAKQLMADAGYADGFTLQMNTNAPGQSEEINAFITDQLSKIGITVEWVPTAATEVFPDILAKKYAAAFTFFNTPSPWLAITQWLTPEASWNPFGASDAELDELIGKAQLASGDEQVAIYQQINEKIVELAWFAPWLDLETSYYTVPGVTVEMQAAQVVPSIYNYTRD